MRIGILSDTHDKARRAGRAVGRLIAEGAEALVHCGDLTTPEVVLECAGLPCHYVFGNNDFEYDALRRAMAATGGTCLEFGGTFELAGRRLAVTHGDDPAEVRRLLAAGPDYLFSGHTHRPDDRTIGATRLINPGALQRAPVYTVGLLDLAGGSFRLLTIDADR